VLPSQYLQYRRLPYPISTNLNQIQNQRNNQISTNYPKLTSAVGSHEEAPLAGVEVEVEPFDERRRSRRRVAVDAWVSEPEVLDLDRSRFFRFPHFPFFNFFPLFFFLFLNLGDLSGA